MYTLIAYLYKFESLQWSIKGCALLLARAVQPKLDAVAFLIADLLAPCTPNVCVAMVENDMRGQIAQLIEIAIWNTSNGDVFGSVWEGT